MDEQTERERRRGDAGVSERSEGKRVFDHLTKKVDEWLIAHRDYLHVYLDTEIPQNSLHSFSISKDGKTLVFSSPAYPGISDLYEYGKDILSNKIDGYTSHFYVNGVVFDRFTMTDGAYDEANLNRIMHYNSIESCLAIVPIFGLNLTSDITIGDVYLTGSLKVAQLVMESNNYLREEHHGGNLDSNGVFQILANVTAFAELREVSSPNIVGRIASERVGKIMSLLPILRKGYVVPDFGIGIDRNSHIYPALTISSETKERRITSFLSRWTSKLESSQDIIDDSIIPLIYELSFKEKPTKIEKATCMAAEWLANSRDHYDPNNRYVSLVIALECLFSTPENDYRTITSAIAEGVAYLLGESPDDRKRLYKLSKTFYRTRSKMVHGEQRTVKLEEINDLSEITEKCIRKFLEKRSEWRTRDDFVSYIEELKFYPKFLTQ